MTSKVVTLLPNKSLHEAIGMMANNAFRHFIVVEKDSSLVGVISDRDLLRAMNHSKDWTTMNIGGLMTQKVITVNPETALSDAVAHILTHRINCLPVVDEKNRVCGIVRAALIALVAGYRFLNRKQNSKVAPVGPASSSRSPMPLKPRPIIF